MIWDMIWETTYAARPLPAKPGRNRRFVSAFRAEGEVTAAPPAPDSAYRRLVRSPFRTVEVVAPAKPLDPLPHPTYNRIWNPIK